jgi:hypothetical protein
MVLCPSRDEAADGVALRDANVNSNDSGCLELPDLELSSSLVFLRSFASLSGRRIEFWRTSFLLNEETKPTFLVVT